VNPEFVAGTDRGYFPLTALTLSMTIPCTERIDFPRVEEVMEGGFYGILRVALNLALSEMTSRRVIGRGLYLHQQISYSTPSLSSLAPSLVKLEAVCCSQD
jgi:hypothetical protein